MQDSLDKLNRKGFKPYPVNNHLAFAIRENQILILTSLNCYSIARNQLNSRAGHLRVKKAIENKEYTCVSDVITDMKLTPGIGVSYRMIDIRGLYD